MNPKLFRSVARGVEGCCSKYGGRPTRSALLSMPRHASPQQQQQQHRSASSSSSSDSSSASYGAPPPWTDPNQAAEAEAEARWERMRQMMRVQNADQAGTRSPLAGTTLSYQDIRSHVGNWRVRGQGRLSSIESKEQGTVMKIRFQSTEGEKLARVYTPLWLRDHCQCSTCVHPDTKQRLLDTFSIPEDIQPRTVNGEESGLSVTWDDLHESFYSWEWLQQHPQFILSPRPNLTEQKYFLGNHPDPSDVTVAYDEVMASDAGVAAWTSKIYRFGYCFVDGCPPTPEATEGLLNRIAFIRSTHYGAFWDFTSDLTMKDTAYTSLPLGAHTDTTYFTEPAGLQLFHLLSHTDGEGGASLLVDGFHAAQILREEHPESYDVLTKQLIPTHASGNETISIQPAHGFPVLELHHRSMRVEPELVRVRWNNDDRATKDDWVNTEACINWYNAARRWSGILRRKDMEIWEQLKPGRPLIFDNWRMLHGRSAFTGKRRICGGYTNHDDFMSRYRMTNFGRDAVLNAV